MLPDTVLVLQARPNQTQYRSLSVSRTGKEGSGVGWVWLVRLILSVVVLYVNMFSKQVVGPHWER